MSAPPTAELVRKVQAGDRNAFDELTRRYQRSVCAVAWSVLHHRHAVEDAAQAAFMAAFAKIQQLRDPGKFGPWLRRITRRTAGMILEDGRRRATSPLSDVTAGPAPTHLDGVSDRLLRAMNALPDWGFEVITFRYFDGCEVREIASLLGRRVGTVNKQLDRALKRLRNSLGDSGS